MYSIKNRDLENLNELVSLQIQVKELRLQNKLGKRNYHENIKKLYEPLTDTIEVTSENLRKPLSKTTKH